MSLLLAFIAPPAPSAGSKRLLVGVGLSILFAIGLGAL
jgi:hypothetical protein